MAGAHGLPHRSKAANYFEQVLMRYPDANGIRRQNTQGWAQPASLFHQHPARQSLLFRLAGKLMDGSTRRVRNCDPNRPISKRRIVEPGESDFKGGNLITHDLPVHLILHGLVSRSLLTMADQSNNNSLNLKIVLRGHDNRFHLGIGGV